MNRYICKDPGHGIETAGKRSPDGKLREYEFNRDVSRRMNKYLEANGIKWIDTVKDEKTVSLEQRVKIANNAKVDLFFSIHANAHGNGKEWTSARGYSVHIIGRGGQAEVVAGLIRKRAIPMLNIPDRGTRISNLYVLRETKMPAVLVEHGFMTNKKEAELLLSDEYRELCAKSNVMGICDWYKIPFKMPAKQDVYRVKIDGQQVIALTGLAKAKAYADQYKNHHVIIEEVSTGKIVLDEDRKPKAKPKSIYHRLLVNGKQVNSFTDPENALRQGIDELKKMKEGKIEVHKVII